MPEILRTELIDEVVTVDDDDAVSISSGAMAVAALRIGRRPDTAEKTIVTLFADFT